MKLRWLFVLAGSLVAGPGFPLPRIQEVFYDAEGSDSPHVFTELVGLPGESLTGYRLVGIDGGTGLSYRTIDLTGAVFPDDGILVIATVRAIGELLTVRDFIADVDWQNGPDALQLWNPFGAVADALQYGEAGAFGAGFGVPAPDVPPGFSLSRDERSSDTADNRADFRQAAPTPGVVRVSATEPATTGFLMASLAGLAACRGTSRRRSRSGPRARRDQGAHALNGVT